MIIDSGRFVISKTKQTPLTQSLCGCYQFVQTMNVTWENFHVVKKNSIK